MKKIGSPEDGYLCAFSFNCRESPLRAFSGCSHIMSAVRGVGEESQKMTMADEGVGIMIKAMINIDHT